MFKAIGQWWCGLHGHDWTSNAAKDIQPTQEQLDGGVDGFFDYAMMYCDTCGYVSDRNAK